MLLAQVFNPCRRYRPSPPRSRHQTSVQQIWLNGFFDGAHIFMD